MIFPSVSSAARAWAMFAGFAIGPIFTATWLRSSSSRSTEPSSPPLSVTKATIAWPVRESARPHGRLGHARMVDERRLDLDRRDAMSRDVHDVVHAAEEPEVAVLVDASAVTGEVQPGKRSSTWRGSASSSKMPRVIAGHGRFSTR